MALELLLDPLETARQRKAILATVAAHAVVFGLCFFFVKWTPPDPPWTDGGGPEVSIGTGDEGFGDIQSLAPVNESLNRNGEMGQPEQAQPQPEPESAPQRVDEPEEITSANTQDEDSPIEVPPTPPKEIPKPVKPVETPKPVENKPAETKPAPATRPAVAAPPAYRSENTGGGGTSPGGSGQAGNNNGDRPGTVGDAGNPNGTLRGPAYRSGSGGSNLDLAGWNWDSRPDKVDPFEEEGRIVFQIKVDEEGNLVSVVPIEKTVSPKVVQFYQKQVEELTFSKTRDNASPAPISTGRITIVIRSR